MSGSGTCATPTARPAPDDPWRSDRQRRAVPQHRLGRRREPAVGAHAARGRAAPGTGRGRPSPPAAARASPPVPASATAAVCAGLPQPAPAQRLQAVRQSAGRDDQRQRAARPQRRRQPRRPQREQPGAAALRRLPPGIRRGGAGRVPGRIGEARGRTAPPAAAPRCRRPARSAPKSRSRAALRPRQRGQRRVPLDADAGEAGHPRGEAQQGRAAAGAALQHALARPRRHAGGQQHRLDPGAVPGDGLRMADPPAEQGARRTRPSAPTAPVVRPRRPRAAPAAPRLVRLGDREAARERADAALHGADMRRPAPRMRSPRRAAARRGNSSRPDRWRPRRPACRALLRRAAAGGKRARP